MEQAVTLKLVLLMDLAEVLQIAVVLVHLLVILQDLADDPKHGLVLVQIDEPMQVVVSEILLVHHVVLLLGTVMFELQQTEIEQPLVIQQAHGIVVMDEALFNVVIIMVHVSVQQAMRQLHEIMVHQQMRISQLRQLEPMYSLDILLECEVDEVTIFIQCTTIVMELHGAVIRSGIIHVRFLR